jgi:hypothetical protein
MEVRQRRGGRRRGKRWLVVVVIHDAPSRYGEGVRRGMGARRKPPSVVVSLGPLRNHTVLELTGASLDDDFFGRSRFPELYADTHADSGRRFRWQPTSCLGAPGSSGRERPHPRLGEPRRRLTRMPFSLVGHRNLRLISVHLPGLPSCRCGSKRCEYNPTPDNWRKLFTSH